MPVGFARPKCLLVQILVAVASRADTLVEDWSGAGFRTKQPLNAGQATVSQVVDHRTTKAVVQGCRTHIGAKLWPDQIGMPRSRGMPFAWSFHCFGGLHLSGFSLFW